MFYDKEIKFEDYLPSEESLSNTNKLLICQDFGFTYNFVDGITPVGEGSIDMVFKKVYRNVYERSEAFIPTEKYKDMFLEFREWFLMTHYGGKDSLPFVVLENEDFIFIDEVGQEPFKLIVPKGTLLLKESYYNMVIELIKAFWSWTRFKPSTNQQEFCGYSKTKFLIGGE